MASVVTYYSIMLSDIAKARFIFTVFRKGSLKAEVRINVAILIHHLLYCLFTFIYLMIALGIPIS